MKILIIGGHGTIGRKVAEYFQAKHEVIIAGGKAGIFPSTLMILIQYKKGWQRQDH